MINQNFIRVCVVFLLMLSCKTTLSAFVTDGLVSYWPFDKKYVINRTVKDVWGENNARIIGSPKLVDGIVNEAFKFDGINDYLNLSNLGDFGEQVVWSTFEAWFKVGRVNGRRSLFGVEDDCMQWNMKINTDIANDFDIMRLTLSFKLKDLINGCRSFISSRGFPILSDEKWHHIVYTNNIYFENGVVGRKIYQANIFIDGKPRIGPELSMRHIENLIPFDRPVFLGCKNHKGDATEFFSGTIDEVRIYNRVLTENEVIQNFVSKNGYKVETRKKLTVLWGTLKSKP